MNAISRGDDLPLRPSDARVVWSTVPAELSKSLRTVKSSGQWEASRPEILSAAEASLNRLIKVRGGYTYLDCCHALEAAAREFLKRQPEVRRAA